MTFLNNKQTEAFRAALTELLEPYVDLDVDPVECLSDVRADVEWLMQQSGVDKRTPVEVNLIEGIIHVTIGRFTPTN